MKAHVFGCALLSATAIVASAPAQAQNGTLTRSFVSSAGSDSNPCTIAQPCASFAQAYTAIGANGIIAALDPGKYGPLNITSPVTIDGYGWAAITGPAGGAAITIDSGGQVRLRGLILNGAAVSASGVYMSYDPDIQGTPSIEIIDCDISAFVYAGIEITPGVSVSLMISNTIVTDIHGPENNGVGISIASNAGTMNAALDNMRIANNDVGMNILGRTGPVITTISHSQINNNGSVGVESGADSANGASVVFRDVVINQTPTAVSLNGNTYAYFSQTTFTNVNGFPGPGGIYFTPNSTNNAAALSDGTSHLTPSNGTIGTWTVQ